MRRLKGYRTKSEEEIEVNMVPIMNMFLVLIPFLLMSASFLHLKAINTSVPVIGDSSRRDSKTTDIKVTVIAEINDKGIHLSANSDTPQVEITNRWSVQIGKVANDEYPFDQMAQYLQEIKYSYPSSDTIVLIPNGDVVYETIIHAMDAARYTQNKLSLFPNVVLSGKV